MKWKLAGVLHGWADAALLDTYEAERLPYGRAITEQSLANSLSMGRGAPGNGTATRARPEFLNEIGMVFGASYDSRATVPDGTARPAGVNPVTEHLPSARPGGRAPHVWLSRDGRQISTLDLFFPRLTLLAGARGASWCEAARAAAARHSLPLAAFVVGADVGDPDNRWPDVYGVEPVGAVLVRPDGHVGWRIRGAARDPAAEIERALAAMRAVSAASG